MNRMDEPFIDRTLAERRHDDEEEERKRRGLEESRGSSVGVDEDHHEAGLERP